MKNYVWIKLASISLVGLLLTSVILTEINGFTQNRYNNGYSNQQRGNYNRLMGGGMNMQPQPQQGQGGMMDDSMPGDI